MYKMPIFPPTVKANNNQVKAPLNPLNIAGGKFKPSLDRSIVGILIPCTDTNKQRKLIEREIKQTVWREEMNLYYHSGGRGSRFSKNIEYVLGADGSPPPFNPRP